MIIIHLAKASVLEDSCDYFKTVAIPQKVRDEVIKGDYAEIEKIKRLINNKKIIVKSITNKALINKANEFNIQRGEAEAVALYWEMKADLLATDDSNVRKKKEILDINVIGTPSILLDLLLQGKIEKSRLERAIKLLKKSAWFSNTVWDKIQMEANKNG